MRTPRWGLVAAAFTGVMLSFASVFIYTFGVFLKPLAAEFGWTRAQISLGFTVVALTVACVSPFIGRTADRIGVRPVVIVCSTVFACAFAALGAMTGALWQLYGLMFVMGLFANGSTQLTWARAITAAFDERRGLALSLTMAGVGAGSMIMPPLSSALIASYGWRAAYFALGAVVLLVVPALAAVALGRGGEVRSAATYSAAPLNRRPFFTLLAAFFLLSLGANGVLAHLVAMLTDRGLSAGSAAAAASVLGVASICGRLVTGPLIDRWFAPYVGSLFIIGSAAGIFGLIAADGPVHAYIAAASIGLAVGAEADFFPFLIGRYMGVARFGEFYGYAFSAYAVAGGLAPVVMGAAFDRTGSYSAVLAAVGVTTVLAAGLVASLPEYRHATRT